jgi:hypothetical protein
MKLRRITAALAAAEATSRPVWVFLVAELVAGLGLALAAGAGLARLAGAVMLEELPPWPLLPLVAAAGAAARVLRAASPIEALRRWHGVIVRRIDERWAER